MASQLLPLGEASWPSQNLILPADSRVELIDNDYSGTHTKLPKILLNGNNICMLIPGGEGPA
ncbi:U6 snRNA-associated Sm-like protein LSm5 [Metarhizium anisopliae]|nr:U6 snRNA-associated Sm-like protein LSm5 [Metarhizium anisopliae]